MITPFPPNRGRPQAPPADHGPVRRRVLFYSHDVYGLGHTRVLQVIVGALARRRPAATFLGLVGSPQFHAFDLPENVDYVKLPTATQKRLYAALPGRLEEGESFRGISRLREALIRRTAQGYVPHMLLVDDIAAGPSRELVPTLRWLRALRPPVRLVFLLRDIADEPALTRRNWQQEGAFDLFDDTYDRILIYGSREVFDPVVAYGFSPLAAAKTVFCGYLRRDDPIRPPAEIRAALGAATAPLVVVTIGGGGDGDDVVRAYLGAVHSGRLDGVVSFVVTGPFMPPAARARIAETARDLPGVTVIPFTPDLPSYLNAADVVVTRAGYNGACEAVGLGKHTVLIPRGGAHREQFIRAERFSRLGLATMVHPNEVTSTRVGAAVAEALSAVVSPPAVLDFGGVNRIRDILSDDLDRWVGDGEAPP